MRCTRVHECDIAVSTAAIPTSWSIVWRVLSRDAVEVLKRIQGLEWRSKWLESPSCHMTNGHMMMAGRFADWLAKPRPRLCSSRSNMHTTISS